MRTRPVARLAVGSLAALLVLTGCGQGGNEVQVKVDTDLTAAPNSSASGDLFTFDAVPDVVATVATGLEAPWGMDFLPDGRAIVTERDTARVLLITAPPSGSTDEGEVSDLGTIPGVAARGESGLLGVAVSPTFVEDNTVFFYLSTKQDNRVVKTVLTDGELGDLTPILTKIPVGDRHSGGRLEFGPDGYLYVTTGETGDAQLARDRKSLAGKILRITADGKPAPKNPFGTAVWSWGHRNVEGIAFDGDGNLWASEFGDSIADELNLIRPGKDYGWPVVEGKGSAEDRRSYTDPVLTWAPDRASPSGLAFAGGSLWMAGLRGERLWRIKVADGQVSDPTPYFFDGKQSDYGRLRTVALAPDGRLWLATSNRDGRGKARKGDDRILLIEP